MRKSTLYISVVVLNFFFSLCIAQTLPKVSKPSLELRDNKLIVHYNITNFDPADKFKIWIEMTDAEGNTINARSLSGDIGDSITGGNNKEIAWDFKNDNFDTDTEIFVEVSAEIQSAPKIIAEEVTPEETDQEETIPEETIPKEEVKTGKFILYSALFPGLGFVKMDKSKLHLAKGAAGYACIASAIIFNRMAVSNYNKYLDSYEIETSDDYYKKSVSQDNTSEVFAYAAIGIWAAEIIWILVESKNYKSTHTAYGKGISIEPGYDPYSNTSMICFSYNF
jgi:hypothetical protein